MARQSLAGISRLAKNPSMAATSVGVASGSKIVKAVATMLQTLFVFPSSLRDPFRPLSDIQGFSDAGADVARATIGGWFWGAAAVGADSPTKAEVWWFADDLPQTYQWLFSKETPQRRIARLELIATTTLVKLILQATPGRHLRAPIFTDNQGNAFSMMAGRANKWPNSAILCELMMSLSIGDHSLAILLQKRIQPMGG